MFAQGVEANIYVVGGASIALTISDARVTTDIDGRYDNPELNKLIFELAKEEELTSHWLNESLEKQAQGSWVTYECPNNLCPNFKLKSGGYGHRWQERKFEGR